MPNEKSLEERLKAVQQKVKGVSDKDKRAEIRKEITSIKRELKKYQRVEAQNAKLEGEKEDLMQRCGELEVKLKANPRHTKDMPNRNSSISYRQYYDVGLQAYKAELYDKAIKELRLSIDLEPTREAITLLYKAYIWGNKISSGLDYFLEKSLEKDSHLRFMELFKGLIKKVYKEKKSDPSTPTALLKKALDFCEDQLKSDSIGDYDRSFFKKYFKKIGRLYKDAR